MSGKKLAFLEYGKTSFFAWFFAALCVWLFYFKMITLYFRSRHFYEIEQNAQICTVNKVFIGIPDNWARDY
jgi:hypothetical protein